MANSDETYKLAAISKPANISDEMKRDEVQHVVGSRFPRAWNFVRFVRSRRRRWEFCPALGWVVTRTLHHFREGNLEISIS